MSRRRDPFHNFHEGFERPRFPLFFKLWFASVALLTIGGIALAVWAGSMIVNDPATIGRAAGAIVNGFREVQQ